MPSLRQHISIERPYMNRGILGQAHQPPQGLVFLSRTAEALRQRCGIWAQIKNIIAYVYISPIGGLHRE